MGNLGQKYTDEEWDDLQEHVKNMPVNSFLSICLSDMTKEELVKLKRFVEKHFQDTGTHTVDGWIEYKKKHL